MMVADDPENMCDRAAVTVPWNHLFQRSHNILAQIKQTLQRVNNPTTDDRLKPQDNNPLHIPNHFHVSRREIFFVFTFQQSQQQIWIGKQKLTIKNVNTHIYSVFCCFLGCFFFFNGDYKSFVLFPQRESLTLLKQIPLWVNNSAVKLRKDKFSSLEEYVQYQSSMKIRVSNIG